MDRLSKNPLTGRSETLVEISTDATGESDWSLEDIRNEKVFVAVVTATYLGSR